MNKNLKREIMLSQDDKRILKDNFIYKFDLSKDDANLVLEKSYVKHLKKDEFLYFNDVCYGYAFLKSGAIRAYLVSDTLREITIFTLRDGEECIICNNCFLENFKSNINLSATEDSEILVIPIDLFQGLKERYQALQNHILTLVSMRFSSSIKVMEQALFMPLVDRIRNFLQENVRDGSVKITHQEIAMNLGSAREAVSRVLKEMQNSGEILQNKGDIKVINLSL